MTPPPRHDDAQPPDQASAPRGDRELDLARPYLLTALVVMAITVVLLASGAAAASLGLPAGKLDLVAEILLAGLLAIVLTRLRAWRAVGFRGLSPLRDLRLYWVPLFPVLPVLAVAVTSLSGIDIGRLTSFLVLAGLIGFVEETAFRGLILRALVARGAWQAAIVSAALFGLLHGLNALLGADPAATLLQIGYATAMGFAFAAVALRTGVIWPLVIIHGLIDAAGFVIADGTVVTAVTSADVLVLTVYAVGFTVYGVLVMPRTGRSAAN